MPPTGQDDLWLTIDGGVYNMTNFLQKHPGGPAPKIYAGKDASEIFHRVHPPSTLLKYKHLKVGSCLAGPATAARPNKSARASGYYDVAKDEDGYDKHTEADLEEREFGDLMAQQGEASHLSSMVLLMYAMLACYAWLAAYMTGCSVWAMLGYYIAGLVGFYGWHTMAVSLATTSRDPVVRFGSFSPALF